MAFRYLQEEIAKEIRWPECWDTMVYPTLDEAVLAIVQSVDCTNVNILASAVKKRENDDK